MSAVVLLREFERISEAPGSSANLRQFVLHLAVRGKIVEQNRGDEPADSVIKAINRERTRRERNGAPVDHRRHDPSLQGTFTIPSSWLWAKLGFLTNVAMGQSPPGTTYNKLGKGVPLINGPVEFSEGPFGLTTVNQYTTLPTKLCKKGDLLLCVRGSTTGRTNVAGFDACIGRGVAAIQSYYDDQFIRLFIWHARNDIIQMGRGIAFPSVSRRQIEDIPVPVPPLAEQRRIVAKVGELMALCDELEAAQAKREARRDRLVAATLHRLNNGAAAQPGDAPSCKETARFYFNHLPRLTTRPEHIRQLRQTILNLAVKGKLVPQDPRDKDSSWSLGQIAAERERRIACNRMKQVSRLKLSGAEQQFDFELPERWGFYFVDQIAIKVTDGEHATPERTSAGRYLLSARNVSDNGVLLDDVDFVPEHEYVRIRRRCDPDQGDILVSCSGSVGRVAIVDRDDTYVMVRSAALVKLDSRWIDSGYIAYALRSKDLQNQIEHYSKSTAQANLFIGAIRRLRVPVPPLAEQHRIVAKVDELMALCDELESRLSETTATRRRLLEATLQEALASA